MKIISFLLATSLALMSCDSGEESLAYGDETKSVIDTYLHTYGFEKIKMVEMTGDKRFINHIMIDCINAKKLPPNYDDRRSLMKDIANNIFHTLDGTTKVRVKQVHVYFTKWTSGRLFRRGKTENLSIKVMDGKLSVVQ